MSELYKYQNARCNNKKNVHYFCPLGHYIVSTIHAPCSESIHNIYSNQSTTVAGIYCELVHCTKHERYSMYMVYNPQGNISYICSPDQPEGHIG